MIDIALWLLSGRRALAAVTRWTMASANHGLIVALALLAVVEVVECRMIASRNSRIATLAEQARRWQSDLAAEQTSLGTLQQALDRQNSAVAQLKTNSDERLRKGRAALATVTARSAGRQAFEDAIGDGSGLAVPQAECHTPDAVLAAEGDL